MPVLLLLSALLSVLPGPPPPAGPAAAQQVRERGVPEEGREVRVFLLTMGQGEEVWERFGHNALLLRDGATGEAVAWNWGLFDFQDVDFIPRFLEGTMRYSMGPAPFQPFLDSYVRADRSVYSNEIHLTPEQVRQLDEFIRWNYRPENRHYRYDYFRDNCSTRLRDALDGVLDGAIRERYGNRATDRTYRWHSRRMVQELFWIDHGMSHLMGPRGDRTITEWEAMFLPVELLHLLEELEVEALDGTRGPLLGPREVLYDARRGPVPEEAPGLSPLWPATGLLVALAFLALGRAAGRGGARSRVALGILGAVWGAATGALGLLIVAAWFTDHVFIHWNVNVFYTNPLGVALAAILLPAALRPRWWKGRMGGTARQLALIIAGLCAAAALLQLVTLIRQGNSETVALTLPVNLALAWAVVGAGRGEAKLASTPSDARSTLEGRYR